MIILSKRAAARAVLLATTLAATAASANDLYFQMNPNLVGGPRQAFIFGAADATGTVTSGTGFSQSFNLGSQGFAVVDVNLGDELGAGIIENKGYKISASTNVSGYFLSRAPFTTDMSYLIDSNKLGKDYVVSTYYGNVSYDEISAQATADNTVVTFTPKNAPAFNVTLNAGQTYQYTSASELTGSRVTSTKAIAVFSGNACTNIPSGNAYCDHIDEQMPSIESLSTSYLVAQTPRTGTNGNVVRVVATEDGTVVKVDGVTVATLATGEFYEGRVAGGAKIDSNNKVLVAEYLIGQVEAGDNTDPAMTIVPGTDQWLKSYVFATPSGSADFPTDFISVIINTGDLGSLKVDGTTANPLLFSAIGSTGFSYGSIDVSTTSGPFSILADNPFQLLLEGYNAYDTYFTYGGAAFSPGASPPPPPIDNTVPEPATWAMFITGFGLLGAAMRRRRTVLA